MNCHPKNGVKDNGVYKSTKRPKEETGREKWERIKHEGETRERKKVVRMAKKWKRDGKMKCITIATLTSKLFSEKS